MLRVLAVAWIGALLFLGDTHRFWHYTDSPLWWGLLAFGIALFAWLWFKPSYQSYKAVKCGAMLMAGSAMMAISWQLAEQKLQQRLAQRVVSQHKVDGLIYINQISDGKVDNWRQIAVLILPAPSQKTARTVRILLYPKKIYNSEGEVIGLTTTGFELGHYYQVTLQLKPPHGQVNAGSFEQEKWLLENDIQATATVLYSAPLNQAQVRAQLWSQGSADFLAAQRSVFKRWQLWVEQQRADYRHAILQLTPTASDAPVHQSSKAADSSRGLLLGLLSGDRSGIDKETVQLYQVMGISHLLAISGPHVLLLATMLTWLLMQGLHLMMRRGYAAGVYLSVPRQVIYLPVFMAIVTFYAVFSGFDIPARRTWIMVMICSVALLLRLRIAPLTTLLWAAVVVLWWDCFAILSAGFWLSFGAAAILLWVYQQLQQTNRFGQVTSTGEVVAWHERAKAALMLLWRSQWRISVALLPIVLWQFKAVSLIAPLVNMVAIGFLGGVIAPLDMVAALLWQIVPMLGQLLWTIAEFLIDMFNTMLLLLRPLADVLYVPSFMNGYSLVALSGAIALAALPQGLVPRWWAAVLLLLACIPQPRRLLQVDVLDVGQGQAVVIQTRRHAMMVDTGAPAFQNGQLSMGDRVDVPFLQSQGIRQLDEIFLSHLDADHSGGTSAVVNHIHVKQLRSNEQNPAITSYPGVSFITCSQGQRWQWDEVDFEVLAPQIEQDRHNQNEASCVLLVTTKMLGQTFKVLIMGDAGWEAEYYILQHYPDLTADVLVVGHHGSRHSSAYDFLAQVNPKLAVISAGFDNRYGHPTPETLARLRALNIPAVNTADVGAIHIALNHHSALWQWRAARHKKQWLLPQRQNNGDGLYGSTIGLNAPN